MPWWSWLTVVALVVAVAWFLANTRHAQQTDQRNAEALEELAPLVVIIRSWIDELLPNGNTEPQMREKALSDLERIQEKLLHFHSHRLDAVASEYTNLWLMWNDLAKEMWENVPYHPEDSAATWPRMMGGFAYLERLSNGSLPSSFAEVYRIRPIAPVEAIFPLINPALDLAFNFSPLAIRARQNWRSESEDQRQSSFMEFQRDLRWLHRAVLNLKSIRVVDTELAIKGVQTSAEVWLVSECNFLIRDSEAFQSMLHGEKADYVRLQKEADALEQEAKARKAWLSQDLQQLYEEKPDQFAALRLSENNLIDLGLQELIHNR